MSAVVSNLTGGHATNTEVTLTANNLVAIANNDRVLIGYKYPS